MLAPLPSILDPPQAGNYKAGDNIFGAVAEEVEVYLGSTYLTFPYDISFIGELLVCFTWRLHLATPLRIVPDILILNS